MKKYALLTLAVALALVFVPSAVCASAKKNQPPKADDFVLNTGTEKNENRENAPETVAVFLPEENKSVEITMRDYVISCVAAEMPAAYEPEALCAQALASVTLARYMKEKEGDNKNLKGADITADPKCHQGYMTVDEMKNRFGEDFDMYYKKLANAVDTVLDYTLMYGGKPALTAFHAMSSGVTEDAANVWGDSIPYLVSVDSPGDKEDKNFLVQTRFSPDEIKEKLSLKALPENENQWLSNENYSKTGRLKKIQIGDKEFTGDSLRSLLNLRSSAISISIKDGAFVFETKGYGHGVGMSQTGAGCMAKQGYTWQEIIAHYYPGAELCFASLRK